MTLKEAAAAVRKYWAMYPPDAMCRGGISEPGRRLLELVEAMPDDLEARGFARGIEMAARVCDAERPHAFIAGDLARDIRALLPTDAVLVPRATLERWLNALEDAASSSSIVVSSIGVGDAYLDSDVLRAAGVAMREMAVLLNPNPKGNP